MSSRLKQLNNSCERIICITNKKEESTDCNFETIEYKEDYWQQVSISKGWLFSFKKDTKIDIISTA